MNLVKLKNFLIGKGQPLTLIAGPCVIEDEALALSTAWELKEIAASLGISFIYKSSYDKANRSSKNSFRGVGIEKGLKILSKVKKECDVPITSDVHTVEEAKQAAEVCDVLQIPAFLCRQTDLLFAAAETKRVVNVKKGQFMAPWDMGNVVEKIESCDNKNIILTERGASFGYNNLVSDMRSIPIMQRFGYPVCYDASHSVQLPGGAGTFSGGNREFIPHLTLSSIAAGANVLFIEAHPNPSEAKSDKASVYPLNELKDLLKKALAIYSVVNQE